MHANFLQGIRLAQATSSLTAEQNDILNRLFSASREQVQKVEASVRRLIRRRKVNWTWDDVIRWVKEHWLDILKVIVSVIAFL